MLDNLRDQASFTEEEEPPDPKKSKQPTQPLQPPQPKQLKPPKQPKPPKPPKQSRQRKQSRSFDQVTHMTAVQRFTLAVMLLIIVSLLGTMFLLISGKIVPWFIL